MSNRRLIAAKKLEKIANYLSLKRLPFVRVRDLPKEQKFAIFPLHMQPEASVDITAPEFSNQLATIQNIARCLPYNYSLLVKEHEMALGCRGRSFYKDLLKIPNVILLSPYEDSYSALSRCQIVFAIASTMGFEAALLGIPVITFSRVFYHRLSGVHYCSTPSVLTEVIKDALLNHTFDQEEAINFLAQLLANSYPGVRGHPQIDPGILTRENVENWAKSIMEHTRNG